MINELSTLTIHILFSSNLTTFMSAANQKMWAERGSGGRSQIVLVDTDSTLDAISSLKSQDLPLLTLKEMLSKVINMI